jgi:uncharacterized protein
VNNRQGDSPRFIADENVGKLGRLLRLLGFDTLFFKGEDGQMIVLAMSEERIILTRDTRIFERRPVAGGRVKALLIATDDPDEQIQQVIGRLGLNGLERPFTLCLECNRHLAKRTPEEVKDRVPPYVYRTQSEYMDCANCCRVYWKGTHWAAMTRTLQRLERVSGPDDH